MFEDKDWGELASGKCAAFGVIGVYLLEILNQARQTEGLLEVMCDFKLSCRSRRRCNRNQAESHRYLSLYKHLDCLDYKVHVFSISQVYWDNDVVRIAADWRKLTWECGPQELATISMDT